MFSLFKASLLSLCFLFTMQSNLFAKSSSADEILLKSIENSSEITNIYTKFTQEKFLPNFDFPITTEGTLFFKKTKPYSLFWEYSSPYLSGIFYDNEQIHVWTKTRESVRVPQEHEEAFTQIMLKELLFWLNIDIENIKSNYTIEKIDDYSLKLTPKRKEFFLYIELSFDASYKALKKLTFHEENKNSTSLIFHDTSFNISKNNLYTYDALFGKSLQ